MEKTLSSAWNALESVAAVLLFAMMAVTFVDVIGRYVIGRSVPGSTEIIQVLLVLSTVFAIPAVTWSRQHIAIGLFEKGSGGWIDRARQWGVAAISAVVFAALGVLLWTYAGESAANEDVIGYLRLPMAPMIYVMAVLCGLVAPVFLAAAVTTPALKETT